VLPRHSSQGTNKVYEYRGRIKICLKVKKITIKSCSLKKIHIWNVIEVDIQI
jgi:hypothetical protein